MVSRTSLAAVSSLLALLSAAASPALAAQTQYPLKIENCGVEVTFDKAPTRTVALGANSAEILLLLGVQDKLVASAFWPSKVMPELAAANEKVKVLTVEIPTFESVLAEEPDFVAAQTVLLMGPESKVAKREDYAKLNIPTYLSPSTCANKQDTKDIYGSRSELWNMDAVYKEIDDLSRIFDVQDKGQAVIADFKQREAALREKAKARGKDYSYLFWFSSPSPSADAYLTGKLGPGGYIADLLGGHSAVESEAEWPTMGWEGIIATNPGVIVVADLDRNRWALDKPAAKIEFLKTDPAVSQLDAVQKGRIVVMDGQAMNPTIRTIRGAEQVEKQLEALSADSK
ncbi:ABC transporter substrate-binding protein [Aureimonas ureilytica]|uniref:ABC transporter substrate-binding protein n=1 Tax=Aureimonas ureilytica TaxID=401562 RepID=A0A175R3V7_9HYPH|nr:ABC transporter substrate-binding protein [Aureimonas ureilytica]KTQ85883.1 ABC transporter substrate-binding protein [Aureimonas ureilytica]